MTDFNNLNHKISLILATLICKRNLFVFVLFLFLFNVPVNNFSVMLRRQELSMKKLL